MQRPVLAANWKMNNGPATASVFIRSFLAHYSRSQERTVIFFPPALSLNALHAALHERPDILLGVQNIYWEPQGAFTRELSAPMARDAGASVALVGHSERRHVFGETDDQCAKKCEAAVNAGLTPMLCVGEKLDEREAGQTETVVLRQLKAGMSRLGAPYAGPIVIAYEPVWAIGTGRNATPDDAAKVHGVIRDELRTIVGDRAVHIPILYGGSVNPGNASSLLEAQDVDGLLVGGASLDPASWISIVSASQRSMKKG